MGAATTCAPCHAFGRNVAVPAVLLGLANLPSTCVWAGCGTVLRPLLSHPGRVRVFNGATALLLVLALPPVLRR